MPEIVKKLQVDGIVEGAVLRSETEFGFPRLTAAYREQMFPKLEFVQLETRYVLHEAGEWPAKFYFTV